jgi:hypothetical protein
MKEKIMTDKKRDFIPIDKDPIHMIFHSDKWEEVPDEDLWQDGELESEQVKEKIFQKAIRYGKWKLIRRKNG